MTTSRAEDRKRINHLEDILMDSIKTNTGAKDAQIPGILEAHGLSSIRPNIMSDETVKYNGNILKKYKDVGGVKHVFNSDTGSYVPVRK